VATLKSPAEPTEPVIRRGRGRLRKHPVTEDHLTPVNTSANIPIGQPAPADILIIIQETPFIDLRRKEINRLLEKGVFAAVTKNNVL
jgi:hypothetical protein